MERKEWMFMSTVLVRGVKEMARRPDLAHGALWSSPQCCLLVSNWLHVLYAAHTGPGPIHCMQCTELVWYMLQVAGPSSCSAHSSQGQSRALARCEASPDQAHILAYIPDPSRSPIQLNSGTAYNKYPGLVPDTSCGSQGWSGVHAACKPTPDWPWILAPACRDGPWTQSRPQIGPTTLLRVMGLDGFVTLGLDDLL